MTDDTSKTDNEHVFKSIEARPVTIKESYKFFNNFIFFRILSWFTVLLIRLVIYPISGKLFHGLKIKNKKEMRKHKREGLFMVCNHSMQMDPLYIGSLFFPRKTYVTMLKSNLGIPYAGRFFRVAGGVPIPETKSGVRVFMEGMHHVLSKNAKILVYPEAALMPYHYQIRNFMSGAFRWAVTMDKPILPLVTVFKKNTGIFKLKKMPRIEIHFLPIVNIIPKETKAETVEDLKMRVFHIMDEYFKNNSDYVKDYHTKEEI